MKYFVAHLIRGEADILQNRVIRDLVAKFGTYPVYEYVPSHITLKTSFDFDENRIGEVYGAVENFTSAHSQSDYRLKGYGNFGDVAIFIDVLPSDEMKSGVTELQNSLAKVPGVQLGQFDYNQKFHATVALGKLKPYSLNEIWSYLPSLPQPDFAMKFDNVAILKKISDRWIIEKIFEIKGRK